MPDWGISGDGQVVTTYGVVTATTAGSPVTPAGANTYGSWANISDLGIGYATSGLLITVFTTTSTARYVVDVGVGVSPFTPGATAFTIAQKLYIDPSAGAARGGQQIYLPLNIQSINEASALRVIARCASNAAGAALITMTVTAVATGFRPSRTYNKMITYNMPFTTLTTEASASNNQAGMTPVSTFIDPGTTASATKGTALTISQNAVGSTTTLQYPTSMVMLAFQTELTGGVAVARRWYVDISLSGGTVVIPNICVQAHDGSDRINQPYFGPIPLSLPFNATVQASCNIDISTATASQRRLGVYLYTFS